MDIQFCDLKAQYKRIREGVNKRIQSVLEHGQYIMGPEVKELEKTLADYSGAKHCIGVSSGTDALLIALMAVGVKRGDAVFLPAFTYTATTEVVALLGATPFFVDVDSGSFNMSPDELVVQVQRVLDSGKLTPKAVIPVDLFGLPADYRAIQAIADNYQLHVIADAAQSFGASYDGKRVGCLAEITATSFFPAKPLGAYGDGGAIFTDNDELADVMRSLRVHGSGGSKYDVVRVGVNGRLDTLQAAILLAKFSVFNAEIETRRSVASEYDKRLAGHVSLPPRGEGSLSAWAQYTIRVANRDRVAARLKEKNIPTAVYYPKPLHLQTAYVEFGRGPGSAPISEALCSEVLSLPMHPYLTQEAIDFICTNVVNATTS